MHKAYTSLYVYIPQHAHVALYIIQINKSQIYMDLRWDNLTCE